MGVSLSTQQLALGDAVISDSDTGEDKIIIERKTLDDLSASIKDGRYQEQSYRLNNAPIHNHNIIYIIEGIMTSKTPVALYSSVFSLMYYKGFSVYKTESVESSALVIKHMLDKMNKEENKKTAFYSLKIGNQGSPITPPLDIRSKMHDAPMISYALSASTLQESSIPAHKTPTVINTLESSKDEYCKVNKVVKKNNITPENIGEIILSQIPSVSPTTAMTIMQNYASLSNLIDAIRSDATVLNNLKYTNKSGKQIKISKPAIANIRKFLISPH